jgi:type I restriction enzyme S subunit
MLSARNVDRGQILFDDFRFISEDAFAIEHARTRITPGDVLLTIVGTIGRTAVVPDGTRPFALQRSVAVLSPKQDVLPKFLSYQLQSPTIQQHFEKNARGTAQKGVYLKTLGETPISLPSLPHQQEIVAEIEKQFSRLDEAVANLKRVKANLKRYKAAVLKAAVEGRLVPTEAELARREGRSYETGAQLLQRIIETRRSKGTGKTKYAEPQAADTSELPLLPDGWAWVPFAHLGADPFNTVQTGPFGAQLHNTEFTPEGVPVIAVGNLTGTGFSADGRYFISEAKAKQLARYDVWAGDLLFARSGATLGKVCVAPPEVKDWRMTGHILRARLNEQFIKPEVAVYSLAALPAVRRQVFGNVRGVTRPGFNTALLESIVIPVPPLPEQQRIVDEVDRRLSFVREVETEVEANIARAGRLRQSVLSTLFSSGGPEA